MKTYKLYQLSVSEYVVKVDRSFIRIEGEKVVKVATSRLEVKAYNTMIEGLEPDVTTDFNILVKMCKLFKEKAEALLAQDDDKYQRKLEEYLELIQDGYYVGGVDLAEGESEMVERVVCKEIIEVCAASILIFSKITTYYSV